MMWPTFARRACDYPCAVCVCVCVFECGVCLRAINHRGKSETFENVGSRYKTMQQQCQMQYAVV